MQSQLCWVTFVQASINGFKDVPGALPRTENLESLHIKMGTGTSKQTRRAIARVNRKLVAGVAICFAVIFIASCTTHKSPLLLINVTLDEI
jgi:hypothetical protein